MKKTMMIVLSIAMVLVMGTTAVFASQGTQNEKITFRSISIVIDGKEIAPCDVNGKSTEPFIRNADGSTYLPVRAVAGALGLDVDWNDATNTVILKNGGTKNTGAGKAVKTNKETTAALTYRDIRITLDGKTVKLQNANGDPVEPFIKDGSTYIPVRAVAAALGCEIGWNGETSTVYISSKSPSPSDKITDEEAVNIVFNYCLTHSPNVSYEELSEIPDVTTFLAKEDSCFIVHKDDKNNTCLVSTCFFDVCAIFWVDKNTGEFRYICDTQDGVDYYLDRGCIDMATGNTSGEIAEGGYIKFIEDYVMDDFIGTWEATNVYFFEAMYDMPAEEYFKGKYTMTLNSDKSYRYSFTTKDSNSIESGTWSVTTDGMKFDNYSKFHFTANSYGDLELPVEGGILTFKKIS